MSNILLVDDHPMTVDGYINLLSEVDFGSQQRNFIKAYNCEIAYHQILRAHRQQQPLEMALLDLSLPPFAKAKMNNGFDLALLIREKFRQCKIVLLTMHSEPIRVDRIIKELNPAGFISKNDINFESFPIIFNSIHEGNIYRSPTIIASQRELLKKNIKWDNYDNQILMLIAESVKTVDLPNHIPLSMSAIEKRKASIKAQLLMGYGSDRDLIIKARELGLL